MSATFLPAGQARLPEKADVMLKGDNALRALLVILLVMGEVRNWAPDKPLTAGGQPNGRGSLARPRRWRARAALGLVAVLVAAALILVWVIFRAYSPSTARLSLRAHPWFFPVLMVHVVGSSVALAACVLQIWPWLRRRHPRVHRTSGRIYVLAGVYPAGIASLLLLAFWPEYPINWFSDLLATLVWLAVTTVGFMLARKRWLVDHRRWMLRSFALTTSFILTYILSPPIWLLLNLPGLRSQFGGNKVLMGEVFSGTIVWMAWIIPLLAVEWWLDREHIRRSHRNAGQRRNVTSPAEMYRNSSVQ
jgi:uncharacterized membrane protein YozB (DUF420 family)